MESIGNSFCKSYKGISYRFYTFVPININSVLLQKLNDMIIQVLKLFILASDIMEAVRGHFYFYGMKVA